MGSLQFINRDAYICDQDTGSQTSLLDLTNFKDQSLESEIIESLASFFPFPFAPGVEDPNLAPAWLGEIPKGKKITFYPGTFNPWHEGHLNCLELCPEENIVVVPDYSPWKSEGVVKSPWMRVRELVEVLSQSPKRGLSVYPGFTLLKAPHATLDWMSQLEDFELSLIIGMDNFISLHKWHRASDLLGLLQTLYVVPRSFETMNEDALSSAQEFIAQVQNAPQVIILPEHSAMDVSSTNLRK